jgi:hypothetical protein
VLSAALTRAVREELIARNVARLVELPEWRPNPVRPWTADEARHFLTASKIRPSPNDRPGARDGAQLSLSALRARGALECGPSPDPDAGVTAGKETRT